MHRCLEGMNRKLAETSHHLLTHEADDGAGGRVTVPVIATAPVGGGDPKTAAIAVFCPFCGERLRQGGSKTS